MKYIETKIKILGYWVVMLTIFIITYYLCLNLDKFATTF
jgi:hypothetical protein